MPQLLSFWSAMDLRRRLILGGVTLAMFATILALGRMASTPSMALLYAGLETQSAGAVLQALEQRNIPHEIRGDAIWVPESQRDPLRMSLASEGLPAQGSQGYELLDQLTGFGTTAQMFDVAQLRAREGELSRTIASSAYIRSARVHIAMPTTTTFRREQKATASVTVTTLAGGLTAGQAQAIRHLVSASVPNLATTDVAVIDTVSGLVPAPDSGTSTQSEEKSEEIKRAVERLLAARVGQGRALVEVSLELVTERESISERRFDPQGRVMISTESETRNNTATGAPPGVTVASNLPEGDANAGGGNQSQVSESREVMNYEVSEVARELLKVPGGIKKLSVAVLVDGIRGLDGTWQQRGEQELNDLRDLVSSAIGFDAARGDSLTIKSMEFELPPLSPAGDPPSLLERIDVMRLVMIGALVLLLLAILAFVIRPMLLANRKADTLLPDLRPNSLEPLSLAGPAEILHAESEPPRSGAEDLEPVERLRRMISDRQEETVELLRSWMDEREEHKP